MSRLANGFDTHYGPAKMAVASIEAEISSLGMGLHASYPLARMLTILNLLSAPLLQCSAFLKRTTS